MNRDREAQTWLATRVASARRTIAGWSPEVRAAVGLALPVGGGVEEGMVLVPREPTQAMIDALWDGLPKGFVFSNCTPRGVVASIIEAALSPTTLGEES